MEVAGGTEIQPQTGAITQNAHPPETELQKTLSGIWQERLGIEGPGIYDDYYELGGNSLIATQIIADINEVTKVNINIKDILNAPTISRLSQLLEEKMAVKESSEDKMAELLKKVQGSD